MSGVRPMQFPEEFRAFDDSNLESSLHRVFESTASRWQSKVALSFEGSDFSYQELNAQANCAARTLLRWTVPEAAIDVGPSANSARIQPRIALLCDQGVHSVVWTLAVLKAGGVFVPVDRRLPAAALGRTLDFLQPDVLVSSPKHLSLARLISQARCPVLDAEAIDRSQSPANLVGGCAAGDLAYIFFTSGSTGEPKGVCDSHRNVLDNIRRYTNSLGFSSCDRMSLIQSPSFSGTVSTMFGALCNGACLVPFDLVSNGLDRLSSWVKQERITIFHSVPSIFRQLADDDDRFPDLRAIRLEGDRCTVADLDRFRSGFGADCILVNGLGATECGLATQFFVGSGGKDRTVDAPLASRSDGPVPIGYPVAGMSVQIVDGHGHDVVSGGVGEIEVASKYLAVGYWHRPDLTAVRFTHAGGIRRYRTGDLGRLLEDGCLVHLGRADHKVKIAGEMIDADEIERLLMTFDSIEQAAVKGQTDSYGETRLVAYLVSGASLRPSIAAIRAHVSRQVGDQMVPRKFVFIDEMPLSPDGKVDRRLLPPYAGGRLALSSDYVAPSSVAETSMVSIWQEVLGIEPIGVIDSFFELGGDSLSAARIASRLDRTLFSAVRQTSIFERPTIRQLSAAFGQPVPAVVAASDPPSAIGLMSR